MLELVDSAPASEAESDASNALLGELAGEMNVVHARITQHMAKVLARGAWRQGGRKTPEAFLCWRLGVTSGVAKQLVRVAQRRAAFPVLTESFDAGRVSLAQVAAAVDAPAWADEQLECLVHNASPASIRKAVRVNAFPDQSRPDLTPFPRYPHQQWDDPDANQADPTVLADAADGGIIAADHHPDSTSDAEAASTRQADRPCESDGSSDDNTLDSNTEIGITDTPDGVGETAGMVGAEGSGGDTSSALADAADVLSRANRLWFGPTDDGRWQIRGDFALDDGLRIEAALREHQDALFHRNGDGKAVSNATTLVSLCEQSFANIVPVSRRDQFRTWLHIDATNGNATTTSGWRIPAVIRDRILDDTIMQPVWERDGLPISVGRAARIVPNRTRRVIEHRDQGCRHPGCNTTHVEVHHIEHWQHGGTTDTNNLISLCAKHHRAQHHNKFTIHGNPNTTDDIEFRDARGRPITEIASPTPPSQQHQRQQTLPPPDTNSPTYEPHQLERIDWNYISDGYIRFPKRPQPKHPPKSA